MTVPTGRITARSILLATLLLAVGLAACAAILIVNLRQRTLVDEGEQLQRWALVLAKQTDRSLQSIDLVQSGFLERLKGIETSEQYRQEVTTFEVHEELRRRIQGLPQIHTLTAIDSSGMILNFSKSWPVVRVNVSDREFFQTLRDDSGRTNFISEPMMSRAIDIRTVVYARKITNSYGSFLGLIVAALNLPDFESLYAAAGLGINSSVNLYRLDGMLLASHPHSAPATASSFPIRAEFQRLRAAGATSDLQRYNDGSDGQDKLRAISLLPNFPLAIDVEMTVDQALADWRNWVTLVIPGVVLLDVLIIGAGALMARQLRGQQLLAEANSARGDAEMALLLAQERERSQDQARLQHARLSAALNYMPQALAIYDAGNRLVAANARHATMLGIPEGSDALGIELGELMDLAVRAGLSQAVATALKTDILADVAAGKRVSRLHRLPGGRSLAIIFAPIAGGGWIVTVEDVTERVSEEARIAHMARHDALTGLPNRILFRERLESALALSRRNQSFALLCLDLDRFKAVNDSLGHAVGDALLQAVAERMLATIRDIDTPARLGGDEFAIIQTKLERPEQAANLAQRLIRALSAPYDIEGRAIVIGVSIGIALVPADDADAETVMTNGDLALYRAKFAGRGQYCFFEPVMDQDLVTTLAPEQQADAELATG